MTLDVYRGCKTTMQKQMQRLHKNIYFDCHKQPSLRSVSLKWDGYKEDDNIRYPREMKNYYKIMPKTWPTVMKHFSCYTQLSMKFFLLINVKMPTIVGILTWKSRKNSILGLSEPKNVEFLDIFTPMSI